MHKAKRVPHDYRDCCERWGYRGGYIERMPRRPGIRGNWRWMCCGAAGLAISKADARLRIDTLLAEEGRILAAEAAAT